MNTAPSTPRNLVTLTRRMVLTANAFGAAIWAGVLTTAHDEVRLFWVLPVLWITAVLCNAGLASWGVRRLGTELADDVRAACNIVLHVVIGALCHWSFAAWLLIPFVAGCSTALPAKRVTIRVATMLVAFDVAALATGAHWYHAVAFSGIGLFIHTVLGLYLQLVLDLMHENERTLKDLRVAQRVASAQEKLASIGQLAAGVAHEINNPMCFITANVADLLDELRHAPALPAALADYRDQVLPETLDGIARVNSIVDDLRRFARGEPEHFMSFDLALEVQAAVRMARTQLRPGQRLTMEPLAQMRMVGMPRQLCQVVLNLIVNGLQSLREEGEVRISATSSGGSHVITVADDGAGMSEDTQRRLFQPFFTTKQAMGIGIGLAVVMNIVKSHHGTIEVESELGVGSRFHLFLPCAALAAVKEPGAAAPPPLGGPARTPGHELAAHAAPTS